MERDKQNEAQGNRQAAAESLKKKVISKSTSETKDKTKYPVDWTKGETGDDGARATTTHERSTAGVYERCGLSRKISALCSSVERSVCVLVGRVVLMITW